MIFQRNHVHLVDIILCQMLENHSNIQVLLYVMEISSDSQKA